jgi:proteic killer suppression protein
MIIDFKCSETEKIFSGVSSRKFSINLQSVARRKLRMLNNAIDLQDLRIPPANRLEKLEGSRKGQHGIRINKQWRICFIWNNGQVHQVEIVDYH